MAVTERGEMGYRDIKEIRDFREIREKPGMRGNRVSRRRDLLATGGGISWQPERESLGSRSGSCRFRNGCLGGGCGAIALRTVCGWPRRGH